MKKVILATTLMTSALSISTQSEVFANETNANDIDVLSQSRKTVLKGKVVNVKSNDVLNVRKEANADSQLMFTLKNGEVVTVLSTESNGWHKIQKDSKTGYVNGRYISTYIETVSETATLTDAINLRRTASWSSDILFTIAKGEKVEVITKGEDWTKIKYNSTEGYAPTSYLDYGTSSGGSANTGNQTPSTPNTPNAPNNGIIETTMIATGKVVKVASNDVLNIRKEANGDSAKVGTLKASQTVSIIAKTSNNWYKVSVNGIEGYVNGNYIEILNSQPGTKYTTTDKVNLRNAKSWSSDSVILTIDKDKTVYVLEKDSDWAKVTYNNTVGYLPTNYIKEVKNEDTTVKPPSTSDKVGKIGTVSVSGSLNVRTGPSTSYSIVSKLYNGDTVLILDESSDGWYKVETMTGVIGWCGGSYIKNIKEGSLPSYGNTTEEKIQSVINVAKQQIGKPYEYGSTGPNSFDCSGLTSYAYKHGAGIILPRNSRDQATAGTYVSRNDLKPGDLVFFNTSGSGISHVGIYIGNDEMIHAPSSGKTIQTVKITASYWSSRYVTARRIIE